MMTYVSCYLSTCVFTLMAMAFFTLLERKILGYTQIRKGPNKPSIMGIPQPMSDALKLFSKQMSDPQTSNMTAFYLAPFSNLILALAMWILACSLSPSKFFVYSIIMFMLISSLSVYTTLMAGWTSNSKYSLLGALRSVAQTISYEVSMGLILISMLMFLNSFNMQDILSFNFHNMIFINLTLVIMWFMTMLAETNRAPFDFAEGESELVSGFNTEYASGVFAMIFMSEYMNIMFMSLLTSLMTTQSLNNNIISFSIIISKTVFLSSVFVMIRTTYPRMRYDRLMSLTWMSFLPLSLMFMLMHMPMIL